MLAGKTEELSGVVQWDDNDHLTLITDPTVFSLQCLVSVLGISSSMLSSTQRRLAKKLLVLGLGY